jgi:5,10-methylene-tetrahydrofolate dehydrogenase/methenyl tetrahydrofolate cyclohydrolase
MILEVLRYVSMKEKKALENGVNCEVHKFDEDISQEIILKLINRLNEDSNVDGIMVQLPLPSVLDEKYILENIKTRKDVRWFNIF